MTKFHQQPDRIYAEHDGKIVFDTDAFPVQLFGPANEINLSGQSIVFPDPPKGNAYNWAVGMIGSGGPYVGCASYVTIGNQEWTEDTVIGTVPAGTDFILARVKLSRTVAPSQILGKTIPVLIKSGDWVNAPGGGILLERLPPIARMLKFFINASNQIVMRKIQSVTNTTYSFWRGDNNPNQSGWTYGGAAGRKGHIVHHLQSIGPAFDPSGSNLRRGAGCALGDPTNYGSTYVGDISITPGITRLDVETTGGSGSGRFFTHNGMMAQESVAGTYTFSNVDFGVEAPDRIIVVVAHGWRGAIEGQVAIGSITIDGVAATARVARNKFNGVSGPGDISGSSFMATMIKPEGALGTIQVNTSGMGSCSIDVYSLYGFSTDVPTAVNSGEGQGAVNTGGIIGPDGGIVIAGCLGYRFGPSVWAASGLSTVIVEAPSSPTFAPARGYQYTTGAAVSMTLDDVNVNNAGYGTGVIAGFF